MIRTRTRKQLNSSLVLSWLAVSAGMSAQSEAHLGNRVYPIPYLTDEMLAEIQLDDGLVDEWYELIGEPTLSLLDFAGKEPHSPPLLPDPSDLDFRIWLAWHDEPARLYLAFVASDDVYKNTHDYSSSPHIWDDSIMLAVDGDHSGGRGSDQNTPLEEAIEIHGQAPYYEAISRTVSGPTLIGKASWTTLPPYAESGGGVAGEAPVIWVIELYVTPIDRWGETWESPEGSVVSRFAADQVIGFAMVVLDHDPPAFDPQEWSVEEVQQPDDTHATPRLNLSRNRADTFLDGLLLPANAAGPVENSAVESVSWGRIKASLELE